MSDAPRPSVIQRWFDDLWTRGDLAALAELTTDDFICHAAHDFTLGRNRAEYGPAVAWYHQCFENPNWLIDDVIVAGDQVVVRSTGTASYRGGWLDIPGHGQRTHECCITIFRMVNEKIAEVWFEVSDLAVVHQLGAVVAVPTSTAEDQ